mgnify:FL=1
MTGVVLLRLGYKLGLGVSGGRARTGVMFRLPRPERVLPEAYLAGEPRRAVREGALPVPERDEHHQHVRAGLHHAAHPDALEGTRGQDDHRLGAARAAGERVRSCTAVLWG